MGQALPHQLQKAAVFGDQRFRPCQRKMSCQGWWAVRSRPVMSTIGLVTKEILFLLGLGVCIIFLLTDKVPLYLTVKPAEISGCIAKLYDISNQIHLQFCQESKSMAPRGGELFRSSKRPNEFIPLEGPWVFLN